MRILVVGSGGREHALVFRLAQSPNVEKIFVAPGNGGTCEIAENVPIAVSDIEALVNFAQKENIDLVIPGPELPLTLGITDAMNKVGIACFGPDKYCARLEGSKSFAKNIMRQAGVPTADFRVFDNPQKAKDYVLALQKPVVVKADGLAAGKGVVVADDSDTALEAISAMLENEKFGDSGKTIIIEEKLEGEEVSLLCLCDGKTALPLPSSQDHKAVFDGDRGPNTGGMGAYSPAPCLPDADLHKMADLVVSPILEALASAGHPFKGILYAGLMLTKAGPKVLEYNVRFGDPECQPILMRMESDLASHMLACTRGELDKEELVFTPKPALGVVLAAKGYPEEYPKDLPINGIEQTDKDVVIFHGGTKKKSGGIFSSGGRVLCVTALGKTLADAQNKAYAALKKIAMPHAHFRTDIGAKGLQHLNI